MSTYLKLVFAALGIAVTAVSVVPTPVPAQVYPPGQSFISNGTGVVRDRLRDPHDDRGGGFGGGNG